MSPSFTATLGLPTRPLPAAVRVPLTNPTAPPPLGPLRDAYLVHTCAQLAESAAARLLAAKPQFRHTGLHKRLERQHAAADGLLESLFGHFDLEASDTLNHLTRTVETATVALVTLAVSPATDNARLERVSELLAELAELAGLHILEAA